MKVIDLIYEKRRIERRLSMGSYFATEACSREENARQADIIQRRHEDDQRLLKKLDDVNNALCASDAATCIEVEGCRLSVATARLYLREIYSGSLDIDEVFNGEDMCIDAGCGNKRAGFLDNCIDSAVWVFPQESRRIDPLNLHGKEQEFRQKKMDWEFGLKRAVAVSDATTDVEFII